MMHDVSGGKDNLSPFNMKTEIFIFNDGMMKIINNKVLEWHLTLATKLLGFFLHMFVNRYRNEDI